MRAQGQTSVSADQLLVVKSTDVGLVALGWPWWGTGGPGAAAMTLGPGRLLPEAPGHPVLINLAFSQKKA